MIIWIMTDMEGVAGIDHWDQCYDPDDNSPHWQYGRTQLTADVNAAVAGCFDGGATTVYVLDGHGRNAGKGFIRDQLDSRATLVTELSPEPARLTHLDEQVHAVMMVGQHAMAGTINGFIDHTQCPKTLCRLLVNRVEFGEMGQFALYAGYYGVPLVYVSGDEALCDEAHRQFPHALSTPTKRGTGWETCVLYDVADVRRNIRRDAAKALRNVDRRHAFRLDPPIEVETEWAWSAKADYIAQFPGVTRVNARTVRWKIGDPREVFAFPWEQWHPLVS